MATLIQHPLHDKQHPLELQDFRNDSIPLDCVLCHQKISSDGYACDVCRFYAHRACAEAPPRIDPHPLHTSHPLTLIHRPPHPFLCDACGKDFPRIVASFRCDGCDFNLDIRCALSTLFDRGDTQGKTPEQINLPLHIDTLTSVSTRQDIMGDSNCVICNARAEGDGYACLLWGCKFLIHKGCIQDLYYSDGTRAPRIYHPHPLKTFLKENDDCASCENCGSDESSREFICCGACQMFCCRDCVQVPESIQYPHHPDHTLVLLIGSFYNRRPRCDSCLVRLADELCYGCPSCEFFVDLRCALQVLAYCDEEGMSTKIELPWHEHQLHLCHRTESDWRHRSYSHLSHCSYCEDKSAGPMYSCKEEGCEFNLHKGCTEIESTIIHPHHQDHSLTLGSKAYFQICEACSKLIVFSGFSCELCKFYLHAICAAHVPTHKHSLHEHKLLHLEYGSVWSCKRCRTALSSSFFRCVPCDLNLHEECMELPQHHVNSEVHWHPLTLHETYIEDDSGEYYCDKCEKSRDVRLGAYVCLHCSARWAYHIECVFPELRTFFEKKSRTSILRRFNMRIAKKNEEVRAAEVKLEEMKRELDQLTKKRDKLISGEKHYESATDESEPEEHD